MNFLTKTLLSQIGGFVAMYADSLIQGGPSGGFANFLQHNPQVTIFYVAAVGVVHNYLSSRYSVDNGKTQSPPPVVQQPKATVV